MDKKIVVVGYGVVGKHIGSVFPVSYYIDPAKGYPENYADDVVYVVCVNPKIDFSNLYNVLDKISERQGVTTVIISTITPRVLESIREKYNGTIYYMPERVWPGRKEAYTRIGALVKGSGDPYVVRLFEERYKVIWTTPEKAVLSKLTENAWRYMTLALAFAFEAAVGEDVIRLANTHDNVNIPFVGAGIGGLCLEKDATFFVESVPDYYNVLDSLLWAGTRIPAYRAQKILSLVPKNGSVLIYGKTYKSGCDILTNSKAFDVYEALRNAGVRVICLDNFVDLFNVQELLDIASNVDVVVCFVDNGYKEVLRKFCEEQGKTFLDLSDTRR